MPQARGCQRASQVPVGTGGKWGDEVITTGATAELGFMLHLQVMSHVKDVKLLSQYKHDPILQ